jgi:hypothetical protein
MKPVTTMKPVTKIGVVLGGYLAALLLAGVMVAVDVAFTSGPDAQASSGMYAFGDMLLFLAVFGVAALIPTGAALFFLRPYRAFWYVLSGLGMTVALTGISAAVVYEFGRHAAGPSPLASWVAFSVLRLLAAPVLALAFLVCATLSAYRVPRLIFLAAVVLEGLVTGYMAIVWFFPLLFTKH